MALTNKQEKFVNEYLKDYNATQAALRAGYSPKTAYSIGSENLKKDYIALEVESKMASFGLKIPEDIATKQSYCKSSGVYLIREDFNNYVKIGIASDVFRRMTALQTSCPQTISLLAFKEFENASLKEAELHERFKDKLIRGEWYKLTDLDIDTLRLEWEN